MISLRVISNVEVIARRHLALSICAVCLTRVSLLALQEVRVTRSRKFASPNGAMESIKPPLGPH